MTENSRNVFDMDRPLLTTIVLAALAILGTFLFVPYFPQNPAYHHFADTRLLLGIPNFWNVVSNLPFLIIGVLSLATVRRNAPEIVFGAALVLTAFGSGLYHFMPNDATLFCDRAGIVIAAVAVIALLVGEHRTATLVIAEAVGIGSLLWWMMNGDLRLYGVVQFFPGLLIIILPLLFPLRYRHKGALAMVIVCYAIAKACELYDPQIYAALHVISGHTLKHLVAAGSTLAIWMWMRRQPMTLESSPPALGVMSSPARETTT